MKKSALFLCLFFALLSYQNGWAQLETSYPSAAVLYKVLSDDPAMQNRFWLHIQPITADAMAMNAAVGSGLETHWITPFRGLELHGGIRGTFFNAMDLQKRAAAGSAVFLQETKYDDPSRNVLEKDFNRFLAWEAGAFYPFLEKKTNGKANIAVPDQSGVAENLELNAKVLRSLGARLGINGLQSTVSLNQALEDQNIELTGNNGTRLSPKGSSVVSGSPYTSPEGRNSLFTSFSSTGLYAGIAMQRRKNISIKTETMGIVSSNSILTFYADLLFNPWTELKDFTITQSSGGSAETFGTGKIGLSKSGFRAGFEVRYNERNFMSAGAEIGYRPAIQGQGFYAALRLGIPVFSVGKNAFSKPATNVGADQSIGK